MQDRREVTLTVSDDGRGMEGNLAEPGIGLQNIRDRISRFGGKLDILSAGGTEVNVTIPL
jgi:signal transduction histidine kinase